MVTRGEAVREGDRGQAMGLVLMAIALVAMVMVGVAEISARLVERSRAQNAADAAALAGVSGGAMAAAQAAQRNGAVLSSVSSSGGPIDLDREVMVEVVVGAEHAIARASDAP